MNTYYVDSLSLKGRFLGRVASQGALNAPWGMVIAPSSFGTLSGWMLVGDFGDGRISAFDATTHASLGQITDGSCGDLVIDGLLANTPGNGGRAAIAGCSTAPPGPTTRRTGCSAWQCRYRNLPCRGCGSGRLPLSAPFRPWRSLAKCG